MVVGIDFGTSNSGLVRNVNQLLDDADGRPMPSLVAVHPVTGDVKLGQEVHDAQNKLVSEGWQVVRSIKLALGHDKRVASSRGQHLDSTHITALLLGELKRRAEQTFHADACDKAVISIPVGLRAAARHRLRNAAKRVGIEVMEFIAEPTAAFLACAPDLPDCERVAVFDWGGGTLDVSVLQIEEGEVRELATESLQQAGDAIDDLVARHVHRAVTGDELDRSVLPAKTYDRLIVECEAAKCALADQESASITLLDYLGSDRHVKLDRPTLEKLTEQTLRESVAVVRRALHQANTIAGQLKVDHILLVGGSSRLWGINQKLVEAFPDVDVFQAERPQWAVAQGASALAEAIRGGAVGAAYRLNHDFLLQLSDDSALPLVKAGDHFDDRYRRHHLALVEQTDHAQLVFGVPKSEGNLIGPLGMQPLAFLSVPLQGLPFEGLRLEARLTRDLTLEVRAQSERGHEHDPRHWTTWQYEKLLFSYALPK
jgi:molecular chaperone DnaK